MVEKKLGTEEKELGIDLESKETINKFKIAKEDYLNSLKGIDANKDKVKKKSFSLKQVYTYWVYIMKEGKCINGEGFGVKKETFNGVDLLVRMENINGENKVVFAELEPSSSFDIAEVEENRTKLKNKLNSLKQTERRLLNFDYNSLGTDKKLNYDIKDIRLAILDIEIKLSSIQYGKKFIYKQDLGKGIDCLFYRYENSGLKLIKYVDENNLFTEASENKRLSDDSLRKQINEQLPKNKSRDWLKLGWAVVFVIALGLLLFGSIGLLRYNEDRAFESCKAKTDELFVVVNKRLAEGVDNLYSDTDRKEFEDNIIKQNNDLIRILTENTRIKPLVD